MVGGLGLGNITPLYGGYILGFKDYTIPPNPLVTLCTCLYMFLSNWPSRQNPSIFRNWQSCDFKTLSETLLQLWESRAQATNIHTCTKIMSMCYVKRWDVKEVLNFEHQKTCFKTSRTPHPKIKKQSGAAWSFRMVFVGTTPKRRCSLPRSRRQVRRFFRQSVYACFCVCVVGVFGADKDT